MKIPPQSIEIERIYSYLQSEKKSSIAICAANPHEGVSSIAVALAQRYLLAGNSTLLVDLNLHRPSVNKLLTLRLPTANKTSALDEPQLVSVLDHAIALTGITSPTRREMIIKLRKPGVLEQFIIEWKKSFDTIIFDTSPLNYINNDHIPAERVAAASDGCLLVVLTGQTTEAMVTSAVDKINAAGGKLLGSVYNDRENPTLKNELLREINRLRPGFFGLTQYLKKRVQQSHLLNLEI